MAWNNDSIIETGRLATFRVDIKLPYGHSVADEQWLMGRFLLWAQSNTADSLYVVEKWSPFNLRLTHAHIHALVLLAVSVTKPLWKHVLDLRTSLSAFFVFTGSPISHITAVTVKGVSTCAGGIKGATRYVLKHRPQDVAWRASMGYFQHYLTGNLKEADLFNFLA